jgi:polysaccharide export outer membrane protein
MKLKYAIVTSSLLAMMLFNGCSSKQDDKVLFNQNNSTIDDPSCQSDIGGYNYEYKIVPNNRLSILVFNHPELSTRDVRAQVAPRDERGVLVDKDGTVDLPLIGVIRIAGLSSRDAANLLTKEYSRYIKHAHITLDILNKRVFVLGEVRRPGRVDISEDTINLLEVLSSSGDMTDFADRRAVKIIRGTRGKPVVENIDLTKLSSLGSNRLTLFPNDVVYVEPNEYKRRNMAIAEAVPGIDMVGRILGILFTGKQLTNTRVFNVNEYTGYQN